MKIIQSHLYPQELPNDANHHHFPISDLSVCFYQFVTNTVSSVCHKFGIEIHDIYSASVPLHLIHCGVGEGRLR